MLSDHPTRHELRTIRKHRATRVWGVLVGVLIIAAVTSSTYSYWAPYQEQLLHSTKVMLGFKGDLHINVLESYQGQSPVREAKVAVDGRPALRLDSGQFLLRDLATGRHSISASGEGYERVKNTIEIEKGANGATIEMCLSADEAARRWMKTKQENRHSETYLSLYPDDKAKISRTDYINFKNAVQQEYDIKIVSFNVSPAKMLKIWRHPDTGKTYSDVAKVRVSGVVEAKDSGESSRVWYVYAKKQNGQWRFFAAN